MTWDAFPWMVMVAGLLWLPACFPRIGRPWPWVLAGTLVAGAFVAGLWLELGRPPLRTLGETRLWFGVLLPACALVIHRFVPWRWPLLYACGLALVFLVLTAVRRETHDRTLMPALQSPLFVPHVVLYLTAYALLFHTAVAACRAWWSDRLRPGEAAHLLPVAEASLWLGFGFLTLGLLTGAVWAKLAWGHYWSWDPKETWAFITWVVYLVHIHLRSSWNDAPRRSAAYLTLASAAVLVCWFGVNYLPSAQQSVHTYAR